MQAVRPISHKRFPGENLCRLCFLSFWERRLVTAAGGTNKGGERFFSEAKLWDALTGQEILTLRGRLADSPRVVFDRGGYKYQGQIKALADASRENGLEF